MSAAIWRNWKPAEFKKQVMDELVANGEIVGKFLETEARQRLLAVREPEWGAGYRSYIATYLLTNTVVREKNAVVIWVGVKTGPKGSQHGLWIELGTRTTQKRPGHPPRPYLRPAVFENARQIVALLAGR